MKKLLFLFLLACQAKGGDRSVDLNGDGVIDPGEASVRAPDVINQEAPSSPVATVSGQVKDAYTGAPVANAKVTISASRLQAEMTPALLETTTFEDGSFSLNNAPPGVAYLVVTVDGYVTAEIPVTVNLADIGGPTNNYVNNTGPIYIVAAGDAQISVPVNDADGEAIPDGTTLTAQYPNAFQQLAADDPFSGLRAASVTTVVATVTGGVAVFAGVPDITRCQGLHGAGVSPEPVMFLITGCSAKSAGSEVNDLIIAPVAFTRAQLCAAPNGILPGLSAQNITGAEAFAVVGANVAGVTAPTAMPPPLATTEPLRFVFNAPVNAAVSSLYVISSYAHDPTPNDGPETGNNRYDNSTPLYAGEQQLVDAVNVALTTSVDPSGRVVTAPAPGGGWIAGAIYLVRGVFVPQVPASTPGAPQALVAFDGWFSVRPSGAFSIRRAIATRDAAQDSGFGQYQRIALHTSAAIKGKGPDGGPYYVYVCTTTALDPGTDDDPYVDDVLVPGHRTLRTGRCPTNPIREEDKGALVQARLREGTNTALDGFTDVIDVDLQDFAWGATRPTAMNLTVLPNIVTELGLDIVEGVVRTADEVPVASTAVGTTVDVTVTAQRGGFLPPAAVSVFCLGNANTACP